MSAEGQVYDVIIIGGGPSALSEALSLASTNLRVLVVSEQFGGCMDMMGELSLQSYVPELEIAGAAHRLVGFMESKTKSRPTGREYSAYIRACFGALAVDRLHATVTSINKSNGRFTLLASSARSNQTLYCRRLVLATGIRPRSPSQAAMSDTQVSCFEAFQRLTSNRIECFAGRNVCIIGSGNTAFQLAYSMARIAQRITLLAKKYIGVYPIDSTDRFALRSDSLQALELIEKTSAQTGSVGPINAADGSLAPIYVHLYEDLQRDNASGVLRASIPVRTNQATVLTNSLQAAVRNGYINRVDDMKYSWSATLNDVTTISAIGVEANRIHSPWAELANGGSFIQHHHGRTAVPGLYVTGCAGGYPSVNSMHPVSPAVEREKALEWPD